MDVNPVPEALIDQAGITRIGDLTGLDRIGLPVWFACRPNSRSLSVAQGKGLTHEAARLSAIMEALEHDHAERLADAGNLRRASYKDCLAGGETLIPLDDMNACIAQHFDPARVRDWVAGRNLSSGEAVLAPFELVGIDYRADAPWDRAAFRMSTVGLGAGFSRAAAILHAIFEIIENDATSVIDIFGSLSSLLNPLDVGKVRHAGLGRAIARTAQAGASPRFAQVPGRTGLPVIACFVDGPSGEHGEFKRSFAGYACRPDPEEAALAALLEAVQSRLTDIAGTRDDIDPEDYLRQSTAWNPTGPAAGLGDITPGLTFAPDEDNEARLERVRALVAPVMPGDFYAFDLGGDEVVSVVRVLHSGMESAAEEGYVRLGASGLAALLAAGDRR